MSAPDQPPSPDEIPDSQAPTAPAADARLSEAARRARVDALIARIVEENHDLLVALAAR
jgi:hypothetical protein